jgi:hypothetical protein
MQHLEQSTIQILYSSWMSLAIYPDSATEVMHVDHSVAASATGDTGDVHPLSSTDYWDRSF